MSVDLWLVPPARPDDKILPEDAPIPEGSFEVNFTYNYGPMWHKATGRNQTADLDGLTGTQSLPILDAAIAAVESDSAGFRALNPSNGWGNSVWFHEKLLACREAARSNPDHVWGAWR